MIGAGFVVTASWPIDTEMQGGLKELLRSQLRFGSSAENVLQMRGWVITVTFKIRSEMQERITERLRYFWDAGIQGPDFVWAAIGPALEYYSRYKEVRQQNG